MKKVLKKLRDKDLRSFEAWKHILLSLFIKGTSIVVNLALIPICLKFLGAEQYGVWITLSTIFLWVGYLDIGLGNGMRNRLAEALAAGDQNLAKELVSTAYYYTAWIFIGLILLLCLLNPWINWGALLNAPDTLSKDLHTAAYIVVILYGSQFIFKLVGNILFALQLPAWNNVIIPIANIFIIICLYNIEHNYLGLSNFVIISILYSLFPMLSYLLASVVLFNNKRYRFLRPELRFVNKNIFKSIFGLGLLFFIIQLSAVIMQSTTNFIITRIYSPIEVTYFDISFKYFNVLRMVFIIIMLPYWSAVTDAFVKKDIAWIKKSFKMLTLISLVFIVGLFILYFFADTVFMLWLDSEIVIPRNITIGVGIFVGGFIFTETVMQILNGIGKIKIQGYLSIVVVIINIPITILLSYTPLGITGVIIAPVISRLLKFVFALIQYNKIMAGKTNGIWYE